MIREMATLEDLVIAARAGNDEAFMDLVQIETPEAYRVTLAILRQPHDAEDALQEAFVRAWRDLPSLRDAARWPGWFRRITVTSAIDTSRRKNARRLVPPGFHEPPPSANASAGVGERDEVMRAMSHRDAAVGTRKCRELTQPALAVQSAGWSQRTLWGCVVSTGAGDRRTRAEVGLQAS